MLIARVVAFLTRQAHRPRRALVVTTAVVTLGLGAIVGAVLLLGGGVAGLLGVILLAVLASLVGSVLALIAALRLSADTLASPNRDLPQDEDLRATIQELRDQARSIEERVATLRIHEGVRLREDGRQLAALGELDAAVDAYERLVTLVDGPPSALTADDVPASSTAPDEVRRERAGAAPTSGASGSGVPGDGAPMSGVSVSTVPVPGARSLWSLPLRAWRGSGGAAALHRAEITQEHLEVLERQIVTDGVEVGLGFARAADRQLAAGNLDHGLAVAERGLQLAPKSLRLRDRRVSILAGLGRHDEALPLAVEAAERRSEHLQRVRAAQAGTLRPPPAVVAAEAASDRSTPRDGVGARTGGQYLDVHGRIAISGYFYSGSGAVKDLLRGAPGAALWPPVGELRIVKFPGGYADLARRATSQRTLRPVDLVDHYLHLVGRRWTGTDPGVYDRWEVTNANSRRLWRRKRQTAGYLDACLDGFRTLVAETEVGPVTAPDVEELARSTLAVALDRAAGDLGAQRLIIDQVVTAWQLEQARLLPPMSFLIVHRDPRDQFAEVREVLAEPGRPTANRDPRSFAKRYRRHREAAASAQAWLEGCGHRVMLLGFEDLVLEPEDTIERIAAFLGLASLPWGGFDPSVSRRNVGKYVGLLPAEEVAVLEELLGDLLDPRAVPAAATRSG